MRLHRSAVAAGVRLIACDTVGSTNEEALALARTGAPVPLWVTARRQTAGRGRRGRQWVSEAGNLYASLLLNNPSSPERAPELSFVAALAATDAILEAAPQLAARLSLKWPNDLLLDRAKVAGILVEGESMSSRTFAVVIGIGVNCTHSPGNTSTATTSLAATGIEITPAVLFPQLSAAMRDRIQQWDHGKGFSTIRADWLMRAAGIGEVIRVRTAHVDSEGVFTGLDAAGRLILAMADGSTRSIGAGEVFPFGAPEPPTTGSDRTRDDVSSEDAAKAALTRQARLTDMPASENGEWESR